jgi:hypothetical protein
MHEWCPLKPGVRIPALINSSTSFWIGRLVRSNHGLPVPRATILLFWADRLTTEIWRQRLENGVLAGSPEKMLTNLHVGDWGLWALGRKGI